MFRKMTLTSTISLVGLLSPVCLLECKRVLKDLKSGETVALLLDDRYVLKDLVTIIQRSDDEILEISEQTDHSRITIRKR